MLPPRCSSPPCMNIAVKTVSAGRRQVVAGADAVEHVNVPATGAHCSPGCVISYGIVA